jgi:hypothetical protein
MFIIDLFIGCHHNGSSVIIIIIMDTFLITTTSLVLVVGHVEIGCGFVMFLCFNCGLFRYGTLYQNQTLANLILCVVC